MEGGWGDDLRMGSWFKIRRNLLALSSLCSPGLWGAFPFPSNGSRLIGKCLSPTALFRNPFICRSERFKLVYLFIKGTHTREQFEFRAKTRLKCSICPVTVTSSRKGLPAQTIRISGCLEGKVGGNKARGGCLIARICEIVSPGFCGKGLIEWMTAIISARMR
ncbi:hypothetical protein CEXT_743331 [Caerostris extrusa]|uniref:Uncharacterized protein n=1 Tax=Caerostris extrusa TaxID=172846 RepID=A0AAV4VT88_CAEEX|nr:hypothetical protein CEXT_743331 [Caerostris extrusa]